MWFFAAVDDPLLRGHATPLSRKTRRLADEEGDIAVELSREIAKTRRIVQYEQFAKRRNLAMSLGWLDGVFSKLAEEA